MFENGRPSETVKQFFRRPFTAYVGCAAPRRRTRFAAGGGCLACLGNGRPSEKQISGVASPPPHFQTASYWFKRRRKRASRDAGIGAESNRCRRRSADVQLGRFAGFHNHGKQRVQREFFGFAVDRVGNARAAYAQNLGSLRLFQPVFGNPAANRGGFFGGNQCAAVGFKFGGFCGRKAQIGKNIAVGRDDMGGLLFIFKLLYQSETFVKP